MAGDMGRLPHRSHLVWGVDLVRRIDLGRINISGIIVVAMLFGLITAAAIHPPSERRVPTVSELDRRITAYHESGHALLAAALPEGGEILEVTVVSRWGTLGSVTRAAESSDLSETARRARREAELVIALGGLIAEEIALGAGQPGETMTSDLKAAEKIALELLGGMEAGLTIAEAEAGVARLIRAAERRARDILARREDALHTLAAALLEHDTMSGAEVAVILGESSLGTD